MSVTDCPETCCDQCAQEASKSKEMQGCDYVMTGESLKCDSICGSIEPEMGRRAATDVSGRRERGDRFPTP